MKTRYVMKNNKGFSLVELIIVIAIMAILAAAIAPALIRYINKSRKAVDVQTAEVIFKAAELASTSADDDVAAGWVIATQEGTPQRGRTEVYSSGHSWLVDKVGSKYYVDVVAWCRGVIVSGSHSEAENTLFKSQIDGGAAGELQRAYTNEFLRALIHDEAVGEIDHGGERKYDGINSHEFLGFRYTRALGKDKNGKEIKPECWILCIREDTLTPEIWIGVKNGDPTPYYRIYPEPCTEYTN